MIFTVLYPGTVKPTKTIVLNAEHIVLKPGTLDKTSDFKPSADIWLKSKQVWFVPPSDTEHFEGQPNFKEFLKV